MQASPFHNNGVLSFISLFQMSIVKPCNQQRNHKSCDNAYQPNLIQNILGTFNTRRYDINRCHPEYRPSQFNTVYAVNRLEGQQVIPSIYFFINVPFFSLIFLQYTTHILHNPLSHFEAC